MKNDNDVKTNKITASIVIPVYNGSNYLQKNVESLLAQTIKDIEIIIVDDASTDNTPEIMTDLSKKDSRIRIFFNEVNKGVIKTVNIGARYASGEYIMFTGHDDLFLPEHLEMMISDFSEDTAFVHCNSIVIDENGTPGRLLKKNSVQKIKTAAFDKFIYTDNFISSCGLVIRKKIFDDIKGHIEEHRTYGEWMLWIRLSALGRVKYNSKINALYRIHSNNQSKTVLKKDNKGEFSDSLKNHLANCRKKVKADKGHNFFNRIFYLIADLFIR